MPQPQKPKQVPNDPNKGKYRKAARGILSSMNRMAMYFGGATLVQAEEYRQDNIETEGDEEEVQAAAAGQIRQDRSLIGPLAAV